jgi:tripartite ATP-independent transporter DctP family solute receptor
VKGIALFLLLIVTSSYSYSREDSPLIIRMGYGLKEQSHQGHAVRYFADEVAKRSNGKMLVRSIGDAALGPDIQMQQALIRGTQEMMVGSTATLVHISDQMALWDTPFLFANTAEADAVLDGPVGEKVLDSLKGEGLVGLVYWENGFRNLTNAKRPVRSLEDFDGLKLRVMQNDIYLQSFSLLGVDAVPLPFSELFFALESKAVDGQENPFATILTSQFFELQQYLSITNHVYSPWVMLASKGWWDELTDDQRSILMDAAIASRAFQRNHARKESEKAVAALKNKGMLINEFPASEHLRMQERLCEVHALIAARVGKSIWQDTQSQLTELRQPRSLFSFMKRSSSAAANTQASGASPCP